MNVIKIKNLDLNFKKKIVLEGVSFTLESGKIYGFLGNNGAGKTSTIKLIFNELTSKIGSITYNDVLQKNVDYSKWYFFAENNELPLNLTVAEYLEIMSTLARRDFRKAKQEFIENEKSLNVSFKMSKKIKLFSAGERKILSTLLMLILKPEVIFFDEPTANLDLKNKEIILNMIKLMQDQNRIIVIATHLIDEVKDLLTDLVILDQGKITYAKPYTKEEDLKLIFHNNTTDIESINYGSLQKTVSIN